MYYWPLRCCLLGLHYHTVPPPSLALSWDCQLLQQKLKLIWPPTVCVSEFMWVITSLSWWNLTRDGAMMNWSGTSWLCWSIWEASPRWTRVTLQTLHHHHPPPPFNPGFWLLPFEWPPICPLAFWCPNPVIFILWSLRACSARVQTHRTIHTASWWEGAKA